MPIPLPYPSMSFTPLDVLTAEEMNQIVTNYTYIANNAGEGGGGASVLDCYPVGSYYETSDTSFNPNAAWGGTWVLDSQGRVTVAQDSGTFGTVGAIGGTEAVSHKHTTQAHALTPTEIPPHSHFPSDGSFLGSDVQINLGVKGYDLSSSVLPGDVHVVFSRSTGTLYNQATTGYNVPAGGSHTHGDTGYTQASTVQPYVVVRRWHRTA